jgi:hypothetical protein
MHRPFGMSRRIPLVLLVAAGCTAPLESSPESPYGQLEMRPAGGVETDYDVRTLTTVDGEVLGADRVPIGDRLAGSVRLAVRTDSEHPVTVLLAPGWYLDRNGVRLGRAQRVEIKGSRVMRGGEPVILATEVRSGESTVKLRDASGRPLWE